MISCGIDIKGSNAIFVILKKEDGKISDITGRLGKLDIEDDENCKEIRSLYEAVKTIFDSFCLDRIAIIKRNKAGKFSGGAISFKIEGLIQLYEKKNVLLVSPHTLRTYKKNHLPIIAPEYKYQEDAYLLASYLLKE